MSFPRIDLDLAAYDGVLADMQSDFAQLPADLNVSFQKEVLRKLEALLPLGETGPSNYAYLYDRVASNEQRPQRYGTQGRCVGPGKWEPLELEDPEHVDQRRKAVGLEALEKYKKGFIDICH